MKRVEIIFVFLILFVQRAAVADQQTNFSIAPSPIAYPYLNADRFDGKLSASLVTITSQQLALSGGYVDAAGRYAFNQYLAFDAQIGLGGLGGTMPGLPPITPSITSKGTPYIYRNHVWDAIWVTNGYVFIRSQFKM